MAAFIQLGKTLDCFVQQVPWPGHACGLTQEEHAAFGQALRQAKAINGWYTEEEVRHALKGIVHLLRPDAMEAWTGNYPLLQAPATGKRVGIIMAGNIPWVGFHDLLCVLVAGHLAVVKPSSDDAGLTAALLALLRVLAPELAAAVRLAPGKLGEVDALIATGSNNTARYFQHYFAGIPRIVRKGRTSVAVLDGDETDEELTALGEDVFRYFGLGCRNVGQLWLPRGFDLDRLFAAFYPWREVIHHHKYANNYDYNKAIWLLDRVPITENGFLLLKEDPSVHSPVAALHFQWYDDPQEVAAALTRHAEELQCVVGHGHVPFGAAQLPGPADYADRVDTLSFLLGPMPSAGG